MLCDNCLFYESDCIVTDENLVYGVEYCHYNNGKYDTDTRKLIQAFMVNECEDYHMSIPLTLHKIAEEYGITILFAVESGSRVWGFNNIDSDFDIRFVFKYNDLTDYLKLDKIVDNLNISDGVFDIVGWDISKALKLHRKSNPSLREWLLSDIVYVMDYEGVFDDLPPFDNVVLMHHYYGMARGNWTDDCEGGIDWVGGNDESALIKKYLYVIRCILTWQILKENNSNPKINIYELLHQHYLIYNDNILMEDVVSLMEKYKGLKDTLKLDTVNRLYDYIVTNLKSMSVETKKLDKPKYKDNNIYNQRYYKILTKD